jgi:general secretion pathway protein E
MGIEPFLVASSLVGLLAQRLVRRPCYECARAVRPSDEILRELGLDARTFFAGGYHFPAVKGERPPPVGTVFEPVGCNACGMLGYRGRTGIYELLMISDAVRRMTRAKADRPARSITPRWPRNESRCASTAHAKFVQGLTTPGVLLMTAERGLAPPPRA